MSDDRDTFGPRYEVRAWGPTTPAESGIVTSLYDEADRAEALACADNLTGWRLHNRRAEVYDVVTQTVVYRTKREGRGRDAHVLAGLVFAVDDFLRPRLRVSGMAERDRGDWNPQLLR